MTFQLINTTLRINTQDGRQHTVAQVINIGVENTLSKVFDGTHLTMSTPNPDTLLDYIAHESGRNAFAQNQRLIIAAWTTDRRATQYIMRPQDLTLATDASIYDPSAILTHDTIKDLINKL